TTGWAASWLIACLKIPSVPLRSDENSTALLSGVHAVGWSEASSLVSRRRGLVRVPAAASSPRYTCCRYVAFCSVSRFPSALALKFGMNDPAHCVIRLGGGRALGSVNTDLPKVEVVRGRRVLPRVDDPSVPKPAIILQRQVSTCHNHCPVRPLQVASFERVSLRSALLHCVGQPLPIRRPVHATETFV